MKFRNILPYSQHSLSAKSLAQGLGIKRLKVDGTSKYSPRRRHRILNWGRSEENWPFVWDEDEVLWVNTPEAVTKASDKLTSLLKMSQSGVSVPEFTTFNDEASQWSSQGKRIFCRTLLKANGGRGIIDIDPYSVDIPRSPLYTVYVRKSSEWRVHILFQKVIFIQRKIRNPHETPVSWRIRNHANGFIFQQNYDRTAWKDEIGDEALKAVRSLGLDIGAVDIVWDNMAKKPYVLEVNTAPGLEGKTLEAYIKALKNEREINE